MDIYKHNHLLSESLREELNSGIGAVLWLTGLSGSGKSTIAACVEKTLCENGIRSYMLDGDNLRFSLNSDLGFSDADRTENIRRIGAIAALFAHSGTYAIVSAISPFAKDRERARNDAVKMNVPFVEIFIDTPLRVCIQRDTKGLYKRAISGDIDNFTGISSPYEEPENADIVINTEECSVEEANNIICRYVSMLRSVRQMIPNICRIAVQAGREVMKVYNTAFSVDYKSDLSPLTQADLASNEIICSFLKNEYPHISILSEETKDNENRLSNDFCFIVDPLDGTKEFVKRNGEFTVNIALSYRKKSVLGVVYSPIDERLWYASQGGGSYECIGVPETYYDTSERIFVSERTEDIVVMASRSHSDEKLTALLEKYKDRIERVISIGSSLKGCLIADGTADVYYRTGLTSEWDTAAMQCIVEQAGGVFRQLDSTAMLYNRANTLNEKGFYILNCKNNYFEMP